MPPKSLSGKAIRPFVIVVVGAEIVIGKAADAALTFPAMSVAVAVMLCAPCVRADDVTDQLPKPSAAALPICVVPSNSLTVLFASAVPLKAGVATLVILSVLEMPSSEPAVKSGADGALGAAVSIVTDRAADARLTFPAVSVAVAVMLRVP